jgi:hypothetical protein
LGCYATNRVTLQTAPGEDADLPGEETKKLVQEASKFRGDVVNQVVYIEDKLNQYFARYFHDNPEKSEKLQSRPFDRKARQFRSIVRSTATNDVPGPQDDLIWLGELRNTLAHGKLIYEPRTGQLKIWNRRTSHLIILTEALRAENDEKVIRVDEFLNGLLAKQ